MPTDKIMIENLQFKIKNMTSQLESLERKAELNEKQANEYKELKKKIEFLHQEKNDVLRQIESATALSGLAIEINNLLKTKLAPIKYSRALERMDSEVARKNFMDIIYAVESWLDDMKRYIPNDNRIIVEVVNQ